MLDKRFLDELRGRLTLSEIIGRRVKITRAGREFKGCCPFHNEKTPSFYVNDEKGFFHCFGCGAHGDAVSFRMRHDNVSFMEAVEGLASEAGLQVPKPDPQSAAQFDEHQRLLQPARERHSLDVVPLQELKAGQTDAFLYLASVFLGDTRQVQRFVVTFDWVNERATSSETERHRRAVGDTRWSFSIQSRSSLFIMFLFLTVKR